MKRRSFFRSLITACVAPQILLRCAPGGFKWTKGRELIVPLNDEMPFSAKEFAGKWQFVTDDFQFVDECPKRGSITAIWVKPPDTYSDIVLHKRA